MQIKKLLCLFLCLVMLTSLIAGCGDQEFAEMQGSHPSGEVISSADNYAPPEGTLSDPIDIALWQEENKSDYMDFDSYFSDFEWSSENYDALAGYIELLCTEYDFEQSGETYYEHIWDTTFFDMVLRYTGEKSISADSMEGVHSENPGDLTIFGTLDKYGRMECHFSCVDTLQAGDDGYRYDRAEKLDMQPGESLSIGMEYDGNVYRTTDGRLSTTLDHAVILTDGQTAEYDAYYEINTNKGRLSVCVENKYGDALLCVYVPTLVDWHEGIYPTSELLKRDHRLTVVHNAEEVSPSMPMSGEMTGLSFRVMYHDGHNMVVYVCATFKSEPTMIESLVAVSLDVEPVEKEEQDSFSGSSGSERCWRCNGSGKCSNCGGDGRVAEWMGDQYMDVRCTSCMSGKCSSCNGSGKR